MAYQLTSTDGFLDFDRICRRFSPRIKGAVFDRIGDEHLAEDITQETLIRVYRYRDHIDPARPIWPWLFTIAARVCTNMLRGKDLRLEPLSPRLDGDLSAVFPDRNIDPEERVVAQQGDVLTTLPPRYRRVLVLKHVLGLSYQEIAELEGISTVGADTLLLRARRSFRKAVEAKRHQIQLALVLPLQRLTARARAGAGRAQQRALDATALLAVDAAAAAATTAGIAMAAVALAGVIAAPHAAVASARPMGTPDQIVAPETFRTTSTTTSTPSVASDGAGSGSHAPTGPLPLERTMQPSIQTDPPGNGGVGPSSTEVELHVYDPVTGKEKFSAGTGVSCSHAGGYVLPQNGPIQAAC